MTFLKFKGFYLTLAIAFLILFLSLQPPGEQDQRLLVSDKLLHFIAYGVMVLPVLLDRVFPQLLVFIIAFIYGGCIELVQPFWGREADIMDLWANTAGIIFGILISRGIVFIFKTQRPNIR